MIKNLRIVSACDSLMRDQTRGLAFASFRRYGDKKRIRVATERILFNYPRPASWAKIAIIRRHLAECDQVLWIDADAVIIGDVDVRRMLTPATLNISEDHNGINCGVMAWTNCKESFDALDRMEDGYRTHKDHPWFEQAALMDFVDELKPFIQPKHVFNAYPSDKADDTLILHFPGMSHAERLPLMEEATKHLW